MSPSLDEGLGMCEFATANRRCFVASGARTLKRPKEREA